MTSIGWIGRLRTNPTEFAGHASRCKVYATRRMVIGAVRRNHVRDPETHCYRSQTDEEVLAAWDVMEVFVKDPE